MISRVNFREFFSLIIQEWVNTIQEKLKVKKFKDKRINRNTTIIETNIQNLHR